MKNTLLFKHTKLGLLFAFVMFSSWGWGQVNIIPTLKLTQRDTPSGTTGWVFSNATINNAATDYWKMVNANASLETPAFNLNNYTSESCVIKLGTFGGTSASDNTITITISVDNGVNYSALTTRTPTVTSSIAMPSIDLSAYSGTQVKLKFAKLGNSTLVGVRFFEANITGTPTSTTWDGTAWSNGTPTASLDAIIDSAYTTTSGSFTAKTLTVNANKSFTIVSGDNITVAGAITNNGSFTVENNANLVQTNTSATNTGSITVNRNSASIQLYDYTLWSSPVAGQKLKNFSQNTLDTRFYTYNSGSNLYNVVSTPLTTDFAPATGYLIRAPNNHPTTPTTIGGVFTGVPNNGNIPFTMVDGGAGKRFNLVGNPYPSPITIATFVSDNTANITGTLYFWRKTNGTGTAYCTYAGTTFVTNNNVQAADPNGVIQTGQGFFVEGTGAGTALAFKNTQRVANTANQFFRTNVVENSRIWLNLTNATGVFSQMAVGYMTDATQGVDSLDGKYINDAPIALTSIINNEEYTIQGRALPFLTTDTVPLGFKTNAAGNYTIALDHVDGLFSTGQTVFLKDNLLNTVTDLSSGSYSFASAIGTFNSRFEVVYQSTLAVTNPTFTANSVIAYGANGEISINSGSTIMELVRVYDLQGRLLVEKKQINASETKLATTASNQVLLVEITAANGSKITKKIIQ